MKFNSSSRLSYAINFCNEFINKHPEHKQEVLDLYDLMHDEINSGESVDNEIELFINSCNDLLLENEN